FRTTFFTLWHNSPPTIVLAIIPYIYILYNALKILYSDDYIVVYYKDGGSLYLRYWGGDREYHFKSNKLADDGDWYSAQSGWYNTQNGEYLVLGTFSGEEPTYFIYSHKDGKLKRVYGGVNIFDIKFTNDFMYIVVCRTFGDGVWPVYTSSNLLKVSLRDYTEEYLGLKGYVYGVIETPISGDGYEGYRFEKDTWQVKDDGIYIAGYYDLGAKAEKYKSTGRYKVSLTSQSHEKLAP
ncbi:MAG: hypothetical protein FWC60_00760, partial [Firmicutes bacterium]|nr:hypothetical protein [Bacillota bacterium]